MPILFESFVAKWLQANLPAAILLEKQYKADLDELGMFVFRIDLVLIDVASDRVLAVLDTKYKRKERPEEADIQQIVAYAVRMNTQKAILIYPSTDTQAVYLTVGEVNLCSIIFDIGIDPDEAGRSFLEKMMTVVQS
jgi:5-methylcytosine-specific restriction endonuclease McrBC regulatory subunit McrC